jgi:hypothetical protein
MAVKVPASAIRGAAQEAGRTPKARAALKARAEFVANEARTIALSAKSEEFAATIRVESDTRPGSGAGGFERATARVVGDSVPTRKLSRIQIMRQAAVS